MHKVGPLPSKKRREKGRKRRRIRRIERREKRIILEREKDNLERWGG